jgi:hypothetical protein
VTLQVLALQHFQLLVDQAAEEVDKDNPQQQEDLPEQMALQVKEIKVVTEHLVRLVVMVPAVAVEQEL